MADPRVPQGNLNRIKGSVIYTDFPNLNVTAAFLGQEGIGLVFEGEAVSVIPTMTGQINSPEAFQPVTLSIHLLKTQTLSASYENQRQTYALLGEAQVRPDVSSSNVGGLLPFQLLNMSIRNVGELRFNGTDAGYRVTLGGYMLVNSQLWNG